MLNIMSHIDEHFSKEDLPLLNGSPQSYNLVRDSTFLDIGSGFGKPVFHAAMAVGKLKSSQDRLLKSRDRDSAQLSSVLQ